MRTAISAAVITAVWMVSFGAAPAQAKRDGYGVYEKYEEKRYKRWAKYQRKEAKEWERYQRKESKEWEKHRKKMMKWKD